MSDKRSGSLPEKYPFPQSIFLPGAVRKPMRVVARNAARVPRKQKPGPRMVTNKANAG
jgi:hypothetical protein